MSSTSELTFFLGLQVKQQHEGIFISQDKYVADILKKFDFLSIRTATTPIESNKPLVKDEDGIDVDVHIYRSMIGSLMYLTASRPDIMFDVYACARFQVTPKASHLNAVKRIFRYLKHQPKLSLWYPRDSPFELEAYSNNDNGGASLDRKSTTEYVAAANCCGRVLWIQNQMMDYGFNFMNTKIHIDNESTISVIKNPVAHLRTKHIEIRFHFIRDCYEKRLIKVIKIHTDHNVADLLTKGFDVTRISMDLRMDRRSAGNFYYMVSTLGYLMRVDDTGVLVMETKGDMWQVVSVSLWMQGWREWGLVILLGRRTLLSGQRILSCIEGITTQRYQVPKVSEIFLAETLPQASDCPTERNREGGRDVAGSAVMQCESDTWTSNSSSYHTVGMSLQLYLCALQTAYRHCSMWATNVYAGGHPEALDSTRLGVSDNRSGGYTQSNTLLGALRNAIAMHSSMNIKTEMASDKRPYMSNVVNVDSTSIGQRSSSHLVKSKILEKHKKKDTERESMKIKEKSTDFVTPTKASGEAQEEDISPTILEAAKTLSKVASQGVSNGGGGGGGWVGGEGEVKSTDKGKRYRRRARSVAKNINTGLDAEEEINTGREEINIGIEEVSTGSTKVDREQKVAERKRIRASKKEQEKERSQKARKGISVTRSTRNSETDKKESIMRANGADTVYLSFGAMVKDFTREDLIELYRVRWRRCQTGEIAEAQAKIMKKMDPALIKITEEGQDKTKKFFVVSAKIMS
ncbi:hypothetical protein Tco_0454233 [Tanacetum coccineum]